MSMAKELIIRGNIVDIVAKKIYGAELFIENGTIKEVKPTGMDEGRFIMPGFIDAHVHIESSMVTPSAFIRAAVKHGTIGVVADPHEIANVMGVEGIDYMIGNAKPLPFYSWFTLPSCVPATGMESSGARIDSSKIAELIKRDDIYGLAEMMNYPGVVNGDEETMKRVEAAKRAGKPIDGHFPLASGESLRKYVAAGISTDHESSSIEEGREKCSLGMKVIIREGSAAKDFNALHPLIDEYPEMMMFCTDDAHPSLLFEGHINRIVKRALAEGHDLFNVLRAASYNAAKHYNIPAGMLQCGDSADFIIVDSLEELNIMATYIKGEELYDGKECKIAFTKPERINNFHTKQISIEKLAVRARGKEMRVIVCQNDGLLTKEEIHPVHTYDGFVESDTKRDILKLVVVNRYQTCAPAIAFIKGTGLKLGAVAQSIAHDSHNIIAVGATDFELEQAINAVIRSKGGIAVSCMDDVKLLPLPIAGLMSELDLEETSRRYDEIERMIKGLRTPLSSLQMTLSFMALLVIPSLKISDKGLFDSESFQFKSVFA